MSNYVTTKSGVKIYNQWQDNIVIDSDAIHIGKSRLASENSEDALTWNVFRTLSYVKPNSLWLNHIFNPIKFEHDDEHTQTFWRPFTQPDSYPYREGTTYVDFCVENEACLIFIEAKFKSQISASTTNDSERNQVIRNIDVGSYHASQSNKDFYFFLLTPQKHQTDLVTRYENSDSLADELSHRTDTIDFEQLANRVYHIHWETIVDLLRDKIFQNQADQPFDKLETWLDGKF